MSRSVRNALSLAHNLFKLEDQIANLLSFFLGAVIASGGVPSATPALASGLLAVFFSLLGINLLNHLTDVDLDRINKPHRPLPRGQITKRDAAIATVGLYAASIVLAALVSSQMLILVGIYLFLGVAYSVRPLRLKEKPLLGNLAIMIGYNFLNFLCGWVIFRPAGSAPFPLLVLFAVYDLIAINSKDYHDFEGDKRHGVKTMVVLLGKGNAPKVDWAAHLLTQASFITLAVFGKVPEYFIALGGVTMVYVSAMFIDLYRSRNYMRFYYLSFGYHVLLRIIVLALFFLGFTG